MPPSEPTRFRKLAPWPKRLAAAGAAYAIGGGALTSIGWIANVPALTDWKHDGISMFPNTAACALLSGVALLLGPTMGRRRTFATFCAAVVAAIGGLTLFEHVIGVDLGIDRLLIDRPWGQAAAAAPMRMGPPGATSFLLTGTALVLLQLGPRARRAAAALGVAVTAIATLSLVGHLYGAHQMFTIPRLTGIALQTASMVFGLGLGIVASAPECEPMRTVLEPSAAGVLARRALPVVVVLAVALGWARVEIQSDGLVDTAFGTAIRTVIELALLTGLLWWAMRMVRAHEQALRESEAQVRRQANQLTTFVETAAIGIHRVGPDGTILWVNDAELQTLGYTREEYVGRSITDFHVDQDAICDILARLHRGEKILEYAARMRCKDGAIKHVLIDSSVLWDEGRFVHTQCFTRDVTERKKADEARALLAAIIETTDDAILSRDLDGTTTSWNVGAERMFGYTAAEAIGQPLDIIIPADRRDEERDILARLRRGERIEHYETVRCAKGGRAIDVSLTVSPLHDEYGRIIGSSKIARDITDRKRAEAEREESNRRKDEFIAILAHELRNPLAPVRYAAHYLKQRGAPDPESQRSVELIERQMGQMSRLIDDLLDVSRISRGMLELRRERVACADVVAAAVDSCRDELEARGHTLRVAVPAAAIDIEVDRERLVQVLCNLIGNAAKYTPPGGRIDVALAVPAEGILELRVEDDGIGIPPEKLTEIFDLFARVEHSLDRQDGLGIGLTLVRQLVELHGGTIEARSAGVGHGSEFVARLPVVVATSVTVTAVAERRAAGRPLRIVVADDTEDAVESLELLLRTWGHEVHTALDGEAAIRVIEEVRPDVALLDIGMPKANGYEVARSVRAHTWGAHVQLVALTGWGQEADKRRAEAAGFDQHLVKPVDPETLERLLASIATAVVATGPSVATDSAATDAPRPDTARLQRA